MSGSGQRRTPGLRREEVASLAGISVDYCVRLEQGRSPRPSPGVLTALAGALRLSDDERDHLYRLAGQPVPPAPAPNPLSRPAAAGNRTEASDTVTPALRAVLVRTHDVPAVVLNRWGTVLAQNALSLAVGGVPVGENLIRHYFVEPSARLRLPVEDRALHAASLVAELRGLCAARPQDPEPSVLAAELRSSSEEFDALWRTHRVAVRRGERKTFEHPSLGRLVVDCDVLTGADGAQRLILHIPDTATRERFAALEAEHLASGLQPGGPGVSPGAAPSGERSA